MTDREVAALLRQPWRRSARGNLCRSWLDLTLTVFRRGDGWAWCLVAGEGRPKFSRRTYPGEAAAIEGAECAAVAWCGG